MYQYAQNGSDAFTPPELFAGEAAVLTNAYPVASGVTLQQYEVVALNATGELVAWDADGVAPINSAVGIAVYAVDNSADANSTAEVYTGGYFNTDALVWDANATALQKQNAFLGTQIQHRTLA